MNGSHEKSIEKLFDKQNAIEQNAASQSATLTHLTKTVDKMATLQADQQKDIHKISIQLNRIVIVLGLIAAATGYPYLIKILP